MNLLEVRTKFREISGRFDLVNSDYTDNGADFYINEGRKFLDRLVETSKSWASVFRFADVGDYIITFPHCRAIKEVWAMSTTARWQLEKKSLQDLIVGYLSGDPSTRENGEPLYYSPQLTRYIPDDANPDDIESFLQWVEIPSGNIDEYNTIITNIPTDTKLAIEIKGLFYSPALVDDDDTNSWSTNHPIALIASAMRYIEVFNRNTQGVNDWTSAITTELNQLGMDLVDEEIAGVNQIED